MCAHTTSPLEHPFPWGGYAPYKALEAEIFRSASVKQCAECGSPRVRAIFDPGNCLYNPRSERPYPEGYEAIRSNFVHVHIKDAARAEPESYCVKVGEGQVGYPALLRRLVEDGYTDWLSMETHYRLNAQLTEEQMRLPGRRLFSRRSRRHGGKRCGVEGTVTKCGRAADIVIKHKMSILESYS